MVDNLKANNTDISYLKFRNILRAFRDACRYNSEHESVLRFKKNPLRDERERFEKTLGLVDGWNELTLKCIFNIQLHGQPQKDNKGYNNAVTCFLNVGILNIAPIFETGRDKFDSTKFMGNELLGFRLGIRQKYLPAIPSDPNDPSYNDILTEHKYLYKPKTNNDKALMDKYFYPIKQLDLDSTSPDTTPELRKFYDDFMEALSVTKTCEKYEAQESKNMEDNRFIPIRERIETAANRDHPQNLIFHGAPGTGKTFGVLKAVIKLVSDDEETVNSAQELSERLKEEQRKDSPRFRFVQFHPSYDYTDFVEGLRPNPTGDGFSLQAGTFMKFCADARAAQKKYGDEAPQYYFIIDEINRGDVSNIFGELFFLLDSGYRNVGIDTQYANMHDVSGDDGMTFASRYLDEGKFNIPSNVTIIGTMNDIDRSVDSFDFAMRRRFHFVPVTAEDSIKMRDDLEDAPSCGPAIDLMRAINNIISNQKKEVLDESYALGISYFADLAKTEPDQFEDVKEELWQNRIEPLLTEYLRGTNEELTDFKTVWAATSSTNAPQSDSNDNGEGNATA
ncbi:McrB family protein [Bifidobacterium choerinum]|nr:AAA family ATPase [Bifidobacterium choerinum]